MSHIPERKKATDFDQELLDIYDYYIHGHIDRRTFLERAAKFAVGSITAVALLEMLTPNYSWATEVPKDDPRVKSELLKYSSPNGNGKNGEMEGLFAKPAKATGKLPGIIVVHENRGRTPYIDDVTRRVAVAGFVAFAPDALYPLGGFPTDVPEGERDTKGGQMQRTLNQPKIVEDFVAAAEFLAKHPDCNGKLGVTGFCYGGGVANTLAWRLPNLIKAAVPYYGQQPTPENAAKIKGAVLAHYAELDTRLTSGWPAYQAALNAAGVENQGFIYAGANHGFHNDTTPRYDKAAAELSWSRTIEFFKKKLA